MAPINLPDGTEVSEVILPDGATASEVVAPDGSTVFSAIPDGVVDNFESRTADPAGPYESSDTIADFYSGDTGGFTRTTASVAEGSNALAVSAGSAAIFSHPGDGLAEYPQEGDTVSFLIRGTSVNDFPVVLSNVQDDPTPNCYGYEVDTKNGTISIFRYDNGNFGDFGSRLVSASVSVSRKTWYYGEVSLPAASNQITFELFNLNASNEKGSSINSVQTTDNNVSTANRGIGWTIRLGSISSATTHFDRYRLES